MNPRLLVGGTAVLVLVHLTGGLLAVAAGVNTWSQAWGSQALLAAPVPMVVAQVLLTAVAVRGRGRAAITAAMLLGVACLLSVVSGFFDGGLGNDALTSGLQAFQYLLLAVTAVVGALGVRRAVDLLRLRRAGFAGTSRSAAR